MTILQTKEFIVAVLKGWFTNKKDLDKISSNEAGDFLFNGKKIGGDISLEDSNQLELKEDGLYYTLPIATDNQIGGVKPDGSTITINEDGIISGSSSIEKVEDINDVELTNIADGQVLAWNALSGKWINQIVIDEVKDADVAEIISVLE